MKAMGKFATLANPSFFMGLTDKVLPWLAAITTVLFVVGLYLGFTAPPDYQQGETVRIMFIHVPAAWLAMMCYTVIAISSAGSLIWRHPLADVSAKAAAPIGAAFTLLARVTGCLWGKPMWGAYWVWDARLTSVLVLFFLSGADRVVGRHRGTLARRTRRRDPGPCRFRKHPHYQVLGGLVEYSASAGERDEAERFIHPPRPARTAAYHGACLHHSVHLAACQGNACGNPAAAG